MRVAAILFAVLTTVGCGSTTAVETGSAPAEARAGDDREAAIYGAVIRQLLMNDNTFGSAPTSFKVVYVLDRPIERAADPQAQVSGGSSHEPFSETIKAAVGARLADLPPVKFVRTRSSVVVGEKAGFSPGHVSARGVLIALGPIVGGQARVRVANSWWMNGSAAQWLTYVVRRQGAEWKVTGISGPIAIS